jgi:hypothetical protein
LVDLAVMQAEKAGSKLLEDCRKHFLPLTLQTECSCCDPQSSPHFAKFGVAQGKNLERLKSYGNESGWFSPGSFVAF